MPELTREKAILLMAEATAIYCPNCTSLHSEENDRTGWNLHEPWKRRCYVCGAIWEDEWLKKLLSPTAGVRP